VLEKAKFPRFHIGESILPQNFPLVQELGLEEALFRLPHLKKYGAEFGMGDDHNTTRFNFDSALIPRLEHFQRRARLLRQDAHGRSPRRWRGDP
jgi:hypothetical protein